MHDPWIPLAEVARPHGVRGELRLRVYNRDSDLLLDCEEVLLRTADGAERPARLEGARWSDQALLVLLEGTTSRNDAELLRGAVLSVRRSAFPPLEDGEFYACDVEGATVVLEGGEVLGTVRELVSFPSVEALVVEGPRGTWEIPLLEGFVAAVHAAPRPEDRRVDVASVEGLEPVVTKPKAPKAPKPARPPRAKGPEKPATGS